MIKTVHNRPIVISSRSNPNYHVTTNHPHMKITLLLVQTAFVFGSSMVSTAGEVDVPTDTPSATAPAAANRQDEQPPVDRPLSEGPSSASPDEAWRTSFDAFVNKVIEVAQSSKITNATVAITCVRDFTVFTNAKKQKGWVVFGGFDNEFHGELAKRFTGPVSWRGVVESVENDPKAKAHVIHVNIPAPTSAPKQITFEKRVRLSVPYSRLGKDKLAAKGAEFAFRAQLVKEKEDALFEPVNVLCGLGPNEGKISVGVSLVNVDPLNTANITEPAADGLPRSVPPQTTTNTPEVDADVLKQFQGEWVVEKWTGYKPLAMYDGFMAISNGNDYSGSRLTVTGTNTTWQLKVTQKMKGLLIGLFSEGKDLTTRKEGKIAFYTDNASIVELQSGSPGKLRFSAVSGKGAKAQQYAAIWSLQEDRLVVCKAMNAGDKCSQSLEITGYDFSNTRIVLRRAKKAKCPPLFRLPSRLLLFQRLTPEEQVFAIKCMVISATEH